MKCGVEASANNSTMVWLRMPMNRREKQSWSLWTVVGREAFCVLSFKVQQSSS